MDGVRHDVVEGESWATLDHGRGRWPYEVRWNWGAGSGRVGGRTIGLQVGGQWTDGTGSVENSLLVDGHLSKISEELVWEYTADRGREGWLEPWRVFGDTVDLTFTPFHLREAVTNVNVLLKRAVLTNSTHQAFGHWAGRFRTDTGAWVDLDGLTGWAEDVHNRW